MSERRPQEIQEAFVLHAYPYRETSLLLEVYTRDFGRLSMVARGARRPRSVLRGVLLSFQRLELSWTGRGEVRTLVRAEWLGGQRLLQGEALLCGYYLNELLMRLLAREDPHEALFERYQLALQGLGAGGESAPVLRGFEKALLKELGYAMPLERDAAGGNLIDPDRIYSYDPERGPVEVAGGAASELQLAGRTLIAIARDDYSAALTQQQAKILMRSLINHRLEYQPLKSRRIFKELREL
jgi:DNA repair protein RecO (recombination protein O)